MKQSESDYFIWSADDENSKQMIMQHPLISRSLPVYTHEFEGNGIGVSGENIVLRISNNERFLLPENPDDQTDGSA